MVFKKTLIFSLLFLFLFNTLGYYVIFELSKFLIKKEMREMVSRQTSAVTVLTVPDAENNPDLRRIDKREILFKHKMYDIIREVRQGKSITFYCIRDTKEENLLAGFKKINTNRITLALLKNLITAALPEYPAKIDLSDFSLFQYFSATSSLSFISFPPLSPPPEWV